MAEIKFTINNPKTGKSYNRPVETESFVGKSLGESVKGDEIGLPGYELKITGGSDMTGFPMRPDIPGHQRARPLLTGGVGIHLKRKGVRKRKTVVGREIGPNTAQINLNVVKEGPQTIEKNFGIEPEEKPAEEAPAEAPKEEAKAEEAPKEEKPAEPAQAQPEETPKAEEPAKEEPKEEKAE